MDIKTSATRPRDREGVPGEAVADCSRTLAALVGSLAYTGRQTGAAAMETADPAATAAEQRCAEAERAIRRDGYTPGTAATVRQAAKEAVRVTGDRAALLGTLVLLEKLAGVEAHDVAALLAEVEEAAR